VRLEASSAVAVAPEDIDADIHVVAARPCRRQALVQALFLPIVVQENAVASVGKANVEGFEFVLPLDGPFTGDAVVPDNLCEPLAHPVKTQAEFIGEGHEQRDALPRNGVLHAEEVAVEAVVAADRGERVCEPDHRGLVHEDLLPHATALRYQRRTGTLWRWPALIQQVLTEVDKCVDPGSQSVEKTVLIVAIRAVHKPVFKISSFKVVAKYRPWNTVYVNSRLKIVTTFQAITGNYE